MSTRRKSFFFYESIYSSGVDAKDRGTKFVEN